MLSRDEIGMGTGAAVTGKPEHARPQCGKQALTSRNRDSGGVERVEIRAHTLDGVIVPAGLAAVDHSSVTYPQAEDEPVGMSLSEGVVSYSPFLGRIRPDTGDAGSDGDVVGSCEKLSSQLNHTSTIGEPESAVAELLKLGHCLFGGIAIPPKRRAPDAYLTK